VLDVAAEIARATKDLAAAEKEVADCGRKLGNPDFLAKAPEPVVGKIRARADKAAEDLIRLTERLASLREGLR
jgi:valyl-tRNA synthetase